MVKEISSLAINLDIKVIQKKVVNIRSINAATLIGKGTLINISNFIMINKIDLFICNHILTPNQQRNLENILKVKVIDRSGVIIEIFARRALSREGKLQVQLADLVYRKSRLVRAWTHLERQRGGTSFIGGPGELQIELDRRQIQEKIESIKKKLKSVSNRRFIQRKLRNKNKFKVFSIVGYTNAGKTLLFNKLTKKKQLTENKLFATLDTKISKIYLKKDVNIGLIDTVGFINNIPTQLIESFKATLEEVRDSDYLLNIVDINDINYKDKIAITKKILLETGVDRRKIDSMITIYNKIDLCPNKDFLNTKDRFYVSALTDDGINSLRDNLKKIVTA